MGPKVGLESFSKGIWWSRGPRLGGSSCAFSFEKTSARSLYSSGIWVSGFGAASGLKELTSSTGSIHMRYTWSLELIFVVRRILGVSIDGSLDTALTVGGFDLLGFFLCFEGFLGFVSGFGVTEV